MAKVNGNYLVPGRLSTRMLAEEIGVSIPSVSRCVFPLRQ